jgi:flagellar M-ring protein FliF
VSTATTAEVVYPRWTQGLRPILLLVGIAAAVAAGVTVVLWSRGPNYSMLYANLAAEDQAQITQALDAASIPYRLEAGSNALMVPSERLSEARLKLAGQGLPDNDNGFSLLTKDAGLGVSQFVENARYQHAMETELAHTIASLRPVDGARVHLAVPRQSAFVRDQREGSASVFVQLKPNRRLEQEQVQAIVNLVASSVPDLHANQVTVIDQQGHLLTTPQGNDDSSLREERLQVTQRMEDDYEQRIETIVTPIVGIGRVRAQVVAQVDTSTTEQATEDYKPGSQIVRSEQQSQSTSRDASQGGVPGALSNQPPASGVAQPPPPSKPPVAATTGAPGQAQTQASADAAALSSAPDNTSSQSTRNYEIGRTVAYTRQPAGQLKRLTVAVVVDDMPVIGKDGKPAKGRPLTDAELAHITTLVKDAVGYDQSRGDSVNVVNASFRTEAAPVDNELEKVPLWETPLFRDMAKLAAGVIVLLVLALAVLRPMIKALMPTAQSRGLLAGPGDAAALSGGTAGYAGGMPQHGTAGEAGGGAAGGAAAPPTPAIPYDQQITNARALVNQDPKRVAQVVRNWVSVDE